MDSFANHDLMFAFNNPDKVPTHDEWIEWIFQLKAAKNKKYALEFVEGWQAHRILVVGAVPWIASCLTGIIWSIFGGNIQNSFAVASFILTASGSRFRTATSFPGVHALQNIWLTTIQVFLLCWLF